MTPDFTPLVKADEERTAGEWTVDGYAIDCADRRLLEVYGPMTTGDEDDANAAFIAATTSEAHGVGALLREVERLRAIVAKVRPIVAENAEMTHYGDPFAGLDPADFTPDPECCSAEELAAHAAALAEGTRPKPEQVCGFGHTEADITYTGKDGEPRTIPAGSPAHFNRTPWGLGTMTLRDDDMMALLAEIDAVLPVEPK